MRGEKGMRGGERRIHESGHPDERVERERGREEREAINT
jgi:hypothetical protein